jgi:hypothetical protein
MGDFDNIKTKTMKRGDPKEATWLSDYGTGERGFFHLDKESKKLKKGFPKREYTTAEVHAVIQDTIDPIESMAVQEKLVFESKSAYRRHLKEHGFVEAYGEVKKPKVVDKEAKRREIREEVEKAYYDIKYDRIPISEKERHLCKQEQQKYQDWKKRNGLR